MKTILSGHNHPGSIYKLNVFLCFIRASICHVYGMQKTPIAAGERQPSSFNVKIFKPSADVFFRCRYAHMCPRSLSPAPTGGFTYSWQVHWKSGMRQGTYAKNPVNQCLKSEPFVCQLGIGIQRLKNPNLHLPHWTGHRLGYPSFFEWNVNFL